MLKYYQINNFQIRSSHQGEETVRLFIEEVKLLNSLGECTNESPIFGFNEEVTLIINLKVYQPFKDASLAFFICDKNGNEIIVVIPLKRIFQSENWNQEIDQVFNSNLIYR